MWIESLVIAALAATPREENLRDVFVDRVAAANLAAPKEITPGCLPTPITTTPAGPIWSFVQATSSTESFRATIWRKPCAGSDAQLVVTFEPNAGTPFVCSSLVTLIQNGQQTDDLFLDTSPNSTSIDSVCGDLFVPTSAVIDERSSSFAFDDDQALTFVYEGLSSFPDAVIQIPAYDPSQYGQTSGPVPFAGKLSGSYFDPTRSGEGVLLEIGQAGTRNVLFLSWYTYFAGQQRWIVGNVDFPANASTVTVPLLISSGGQFGTAYDPAQVQFSDWGTATLTFPTCSRLTMSWAEAGGETGTFNYQRLVDRLLGVPCP